MPEEWGLQRTTLAPGSDNTRGQGSFGPLTGGTERITYIPLLTRDEKSSLGDGAMCPSTLPKILKRTEHTLDPKAG